MLADVVEDLHNCVRTVAKKNPNPILSVAHTQEPRAIAKVAGRVYVQERFSTLLLQERGCQRMR